jgi:N-acetyl-anhydromuramyl-L-alanine amidase AmpD
VRLLCFILLSAALSAGSFEPGPVVGASPPEISKPRIVENHIPFGKKRKRQMARYSRRHYGRARWRLERRRVVVLHFTGGNSLSSAWNTFASNAPSRGELPGVCTHYIVGRGGKISEVVPVKIRCRHAIGLNHRSIGIEMVQPTGPGSHWACKRILRRKQQISAALRLVRWLRKRHDIRMKDVIGHAMANKSPYFKDLKGWKNDHTDWGWRDVKTFRKRLRRISQ